MNYARWVARSPTSLPVTLHALTADDDPLGGDDVIVHLLSLLCDLLDDSKSCIAQLINFLTDNLQDVMLDSLGQQVQPIAVGQASCEFCGCQWRILGTI